jgi:hypothetical protein
MAKVQMLKTAMALMLLALIACPVARAQDNSQSGSTSTPSQGLGNTSSPCPGPQVQPDTHPLAGAFLFTLGSLPELHSYVQPVVSIGEIGETNGEATGGTATGFQALTVPTGDLTLQLLGPRNSFSLSYLGGGFIYDTKVPGASDTSFQELSFVDTLQFHRGSLSIADMASYMPEAGFGLGAVGVLGGFGTGLSSGLGFSGGSGQINPMFTPNESVLTTGYGAYSNTTVAQAVYELSGRTSVSAMGSYGTLQFGNTASGLIDGNQVIGLLGLNHMLTAKDTIGIMYDYGAFGYVGSSMSFDSQMLDFTYGRKITGRLSFQAYGGPELVSIRTAPSQTITQTYFSGSAGFSYVWDQNTVSIFVGRYDTGGAGVEYGTETTTLSGNWMRPLSRRTIMNAYLGYSRNSSFLSSGISGRTTFGYWFGDFQLTRTLSRYLSLNVGYEYQRQDLSSSSCANAACAVNLANQVFGIGLTFTPHPLAL